MVDVNWRLLSQGLDYYYDHGFQEIHLDWHAEEKINLITCKDKNRLFYLSPNKVLIGSAEISFINKLLMNELEPNKRYMSITPCFRKEPKIDEIHHNYFMKLELFSTIENDAENLLQIAKNFCLNYTAENTISIVDSEHGQDIEINNIEVGSYNNMRYQNYKWSCGTGIAEPRFSYAINKR